MEDGRAPWRNHQQMRLVIEFFMYRGHSNARPILLVTIIPSFNQLINLTEHGLSVNALSINPLAFFILFLSSPPPPPSSALEPQTFEYDRFFQQRTQTNTVIHIRIFSLILSKNFLQKVKRNARQNQYDLEEDHKLLRETTPQSVFQGTLIKNYYHRKEVISNSIIFLSLFV